MRDWASCRNIKYLLETKQIKRGPCEVCGKKRTEGHNDCGIKWLCPDHHGEAHGIAPRKKPNRVYPKGVWVKNPAGKGYIWV